MRFPAINSGPTLTPESLDAYCRVHGLLVPEPLRLQLLEQNGGAPTNELVVTVAGADEEVLSFFGAHMNDQSSELAWIAATMQGRVPDGLLPFADDPAGNLYVVETGDGTDHSVWFWDHERAGEPEALSRVAGSLDEFFRMVSSSG